MRTRLTTIPKDILRAALVGLETEKAAIESRIAALRIQLGVKRRGRPPKAEALPFARLRPIPEAEAEPRAKRRYAHRKGKISAEGRARIAAAQRKRWAKRKAA